MRRTGGHRSSTIPVWAQFASKLLGMLLVVSALTVNAVTDPDWPAPVHQAELR